MRDFEDPRVWASFVQEHSGRFVDVKLPDIEQGQVYWDDLKDALVAREVTAAQAREASRRMRELGSQPPMKSHFGKFLEVVGGILRHAAIARKDGEARAQHTFAPSTAEIDRQWNALSEEERDRWCQASYDENPGCRANPKHERWGYFVREIAKSEFAQSYATCHVRSEQRALLPSIPAGAPF